MQYIRGDRECGILLWFLSQYCNFGCFQSKTPLTNLISESPAEQIRRRSWISEHPVLRGRWLLRNQLSKAGVPPPPGRWITAGPMASQPPCRGRRPRRPENETKTPPVAAFSPFPTPRPAPGKFHGARPGLAATRRGRRPRRPFPLFTASPTGSHGLRAA